METFVDIFHEINRQTLLLSGVIKNEEEAESVIILQKQIHKTRQIFEKDAENFPPDGG